MQVCKAMPMESVITLVGLPSGNHVDKNTQTLLLGRQYPPPHINSPGALALYSRLVLLT